MSPMATWGHARRATRIIGVSILPSCCSEASGEARSKPGISQLKYLTEHSMNCFISFISTLGRKSCGIHLPLERIGNIKNQLKYSFYGFLNS